MFKLTSNKSRIVMVETATVVKVFAIALAIYLLFQFVQEALWALKLIFIAFFLALALNAPVSYLAERMPRGSRGLATGTAYLFIVSLIGAFLFAIIPPVIEQTGQFIERIPDYVRQIQRGDTVIGDIVARYELNDELDELARNLRDRIAESSGPIFEGLRGIGSAIIAVVTVLVLTFFMLIEGPTWIRRFWLLMPEHNKEHRERLSSKLYQVVTGYVNAQLLVASLAAMFSLLMLLIVGIPYAVPLAGLVGLLSLVPMIGATLSSVIVVTVALFQGLVPALIMLAFFVVYQQIENNVFQPYVQSRTLDVSPLLVLIAVLIGASVAGLLGGFIAIPVAASAKILLLDYLEHRRSRTDLAAKA